MAIFSARGHQKSLLLSLLCGSLCGCDPTLGARANFADALPQENGLIRVSVVSTSELGRSGAAQFSLDRAALSSGEGSRQLCWQSSIWQQC